MNLEHAYSHEPDVLKTFPYLPQIAHLFLEMFEMGSLLHHLAKEYDRSPLQLFGSLKNLNQPLLESSASSHWARRLSPALPAKSA